MPAPPSWWRSISCRNSTSSCGAGGGAQAVELLGAGHPGHRGHPAAGGHRRAVAVVHRGRVGHPRSCGRRPAARRPPTARASPASGRSATSGWPRCRRRAAAGPGRSVWSRSQEAICTACWWCTVMSWANPTSTESAAGTAGVVEPGSPSSRPPAAPSSSRPSASPAATKTRTQRGRSGARAGVGTGAGDEASPRSVPAAGSVGITARQGVTPVPRRGLRHRAGRAGRRRAARTAAGWPGRSWARPARCSSRRAPGRCTGSAAARR